MRNKTVIWVLLALFLGQCGPQGRLLETAPRIPEKRVKKYSFATARNTEEKPTTFRNISIRYETPGNITRLSAAVKMDPESAILLSLRAPLGIEVSRILYTRDSVIMVDRRNKSVHHSDYSNISGMLPMDFDYQVLKTIFSGNVPTGYRIRNLPEPANTRDSTKNETYLGTFRSPGQKKGMNFYGWIYKDIVRPSYLVFHKENAGNKLRIHFKSYQENKGQWFPENVQIKSGKDQFESSLKIEIKQIETKQSVALDLDIPSSYKTIRY